MKKIISISMIIVVAFVFTACSSSEYVDTPVTVTVTDKNGETVTDKDGKAITETVTKENSSQQSEKETSAQGSTSSGSSQTSGARNTTAGDNNRTGVKTTEKTTSEKTKNKTTSQKQTTTEKTTTAKAKKRDVTITVNLPYYNDEETELTLYYKVDGDKKYTAFEPLKIVLDGTKKSETFKIKKVKGEVTAYIELKDISVAHYSNSVTIPANENKGTITPVTGIEIMDGGMM